MKFKELFIHRSIYDELFLFSTNNAGQLELKIFEE